MNNPIGFLHGILEINSILIEFAMPHLIMYIDTNDKPVFCTYKAYKEATSKETTYPIISEEKYNTLIEYIKEKIEHEQEH